MTLYQLREDLHVAGERHQNALAALYEASHDVLVAVVREVAGRPGMAERADSEVHGARLRLMHSLPVPTLSVTAIELLHHNGAVTVVDDHGMVTELTEAANGLYHAWGLQEELFRGDYLYVDLANGTLAKSL